MGGNGKLPHLTDRQLRLLCVLQQFRDTHGYSPTILDLGRQMGTPWKNGIVCHLKPLRRKGYVEWDDGSGRSLLPTHRLACYPVLVDDGSTVRETGTFIVRDECGQWREV